MGTPTRGSSNLKVVVLPFLIGFGCALLLMKGGEQNLGATVELGSTFDLDDANDVQDLDDTTVGMPSFWEERALEEREAWQDWMESAPGRLAMVKAKVKKAAAKAKAKPKKKAAPKAKAKAKAEAKK